MSFVNSLPYISNPVEEFSSFRYVDWDRDIYPQYKGEVDDEEVRFYVDIIKSKGLVDILDLGLGSGQEISNIVSVCEKDGYKLQSHEGNEISDSLIMQASALFYKKKQDIPIHKANWINLPDADLSYTHDFDFAFLTGNSLTYIGGGTREYTKQAQAAVVSKFAQMIRKGGYLFIDTRDYDYIRSLMNLSPKEILERFTSISTNYPYYKGANKRVIVFPAYISDTVVVLHYYDKELRIWSKLDLYPIYFQDMVDILSKDFEIEKIWYDFKEERGDDNRNLFIQFLARRK